MATLEEALYGLNMSPADTGYGLATQAVSQATPQLINPYGSTGQAIGIGLGSILLQSLLGYQARQQAARNTLEMNTLANQMQSFATPQERTDFIAGIEDPIQQSRLSTLATALRAQEQAREARAADTLLGLETGAKFQTGELGMQLADEMNRRSAQSRINEMVRESDFLQSEEGKKYLESLRQKSIAQAAGVSERVNRQNEDWYKRANYTDKLNKENKIFTKTLELSNPEVPANVRSETGEIFAVANAARDLAVKIRDKIDTFAELKLAKTFTSAGEGLSEEIKDLSDLIVRVRSGANAPLFESNNLAQILIGTSELGPEAAAASIDRFANRSFMIGSDRLLAGAKNPSILAAEARRAAETGTKLNLTPQKELILPAQGEDIFAGASDATPAPAPAALSDAVARARAALADPNLSNEMKQRIQNKLTELGVQE